MIRRHTRAVPFCLAGAALLALFTLAGRSEGDPLHVPITSPPVLSPSGPIAVYALASCVNLPSNHTLTVGDLTKHEGSLLSWQASLASPVPANAAAHVFYGSATDTNCSRMWITDFVVTPATTAKAANGTSPATKFEPWFRVGDRRRNGQYTLAQAGAITDNKLLDAAELTACDAAAHSFKQKPYPSSQKCYDEASKDICGRLLMRVIVAWKKGGTPDFKIYNSTMGGYLWDGFSCARSPSFAYGMTDNTYDAAQAGADHLKTLPVPAGRTDTYRVIAGVFLYTKTITIQDGNALAHGTSSGDALFLFNPKLYPPETNPLVEQVPIEAVMTPQ